MLAIFLGKPLHGTTEERSDLPAVIEVVLEEHVTQRHGGAFGFSVERRQTVTAECRRLSTPTVPEWVGVYSVDGYVPQPVDEVLVIEIIAERAV